MWSNKHEFLHKYAKKNFVITELLVTAGMQDIL